MSYPLQPATAEMSSLFTCDRCQAEVEVVFSVLGGCPIPVIMPPDGWTIVQGHPLCPRHVAVCVIKKSSYKLRGREFIL